MAKFYSVAAGDVIVIHDELDIDFGKIRLKLGGGEGGHNGLRSVANALGTKDFQRVRIGIGRPPGRKDPAAFVLEPFNAAERNEVPTMCELAADAAEALIELGVEPAQNGARLVGAAPLRLPLRRASHQRDTRRRKRHQRDARGPDQLTSATEFARRSLPDGVFRDGAQDPSTTTLRGRTSASRTTSWATCCSMRRTSAGSSQSLDSTATAKVSGVPGVKADRHRAAGRTPSTKPAARSMSVGYTLRPAMMIHVLDPAADHHVALLGEVAMHRCRTSVLILGRDEAARGDVARRQRLARATR